MSHAIETEGYKKTVKHVLSVIDCVHDDGKLLIIPAKKTTRKGSYFSRQGYTPVEIGMSSHQRDIGEFALAHEIGHFIDFWALNGASIEGGMKPVIDAIRATDTIKEIEQNAYLNRKQLLRGNLIVILLVHKNYGLGLILNG